MYALTVRQPFAALIAAGLKRYETRSWKTEYRGPLAIHAGKTFGPNERSKAAGPLRPLLEHFGVTEAALLPRGAIIAVVELTGCEPTEVVRPTLSPDEQLMGDYSDDRWAWRIERVQVLAQPVQCAGALSLWSVPVIAVATIKTALSGAIYRPNPPERTP